MMKKLMMKELKLFVAAPTFLFLLLAGLMLIPQYPYFVGVGYCLMAIFINFSAGRANNDLAFTANLPVPRRHIVACKHMTVAMFEALQLIVAIPFAILTSVLNPAGNIVGMDANLAFFGFILIDFAVFNVVFLPMFFKTGHKAGIPVLVGILLCGLTEAVLETVTSVVPVLRGALDTLNPAYFGWQAIVLAVGILVFAVTLIVSYRISVRKFERVNL